MCISSNTSGVTRLLRMEKREKAVRRFKNMVNKPSGFGRCGRMVHNLKMGLTVQPVKYVSYLQNIRKKKGNIEWMANLTE